VPALKRTNASTSRAHVASWSISAIRPDTCRQFPKAVSPAWHQRAATRCGLQQHLCRSVLKYMLPLSPQISRAQTGCPIVVQADGE